MFIWISLLRIDVKPVRRSSARFGRILARKYGALNVSCTLRMRFCASYISSFKTLFSILRHIMLSFGRLLRTALGPTQPHIKWIPGALSLRGKAAGA